MLSDLPETKHHWIEELVSNPKILRSPLRKECFHMETFKEREKIRPAPLLSDAQSMDLVDGHDDVFMYNLYCHVYEQNPTQFILQKSIAKSTHFL